MERGGRRKRCELEEDEVDFGKRVRKMGVVYKERDSKGKRK
jgi:hypothetical protein